MQVSLKYMGLFTICLFFFMASAHTCSLISMKIPFLFVSFRNNYFSYGY